MRLVPCPKPNITSIVVHRADGSTNTFGASNFVSVHPGDKLELIGTNFAADGTYVEDANGWTFAPEIFLSNISLSIFEQDWSATRVVVELPAEFAEGRLYVKAHRSLIDPSLPSGGRDYTSNSNYVKIRQLFEFTDKLLVPKKTLIKGIHIDEIRAALDAKLEFKGDGAPSYSRPSPMKGQEFGVSDLQEIRDAINNVMAEPLDWTDDPLVPTDHDNENMAAWTPFKAQHINELRIGVNAIWTDKTAASPVVNSFLTEGTSTGKCKYILIGEWLELITGATVGDMDVEEFTVLSSNYITFKLPDMAVDGDIVLEGVNLAEEAMDPYVVTQFVDDQPVLAQLVPAAFFFGANTYVDVDVDGRLAQNAGQTVKVFYNDEEIAHEPLDTTPHNSQFYRVRLNKGVPDASFKVQIGAYTSNELPFVSLQQEVTSFTATAAGPEPLKKPERGEDFAAHDGKAYVIEYQSFAYCRAKPLVRVVNYETGEILEKWDRNGLNTTGTYVYLPGNEYVRWYNGALDSDLDYLYCSHKLKIRDNKLYVFTLYQGNKWNNTAIPKVSYVAIDLDTKQAVADGVFTIPTGFTSYFDNWKTYGFLLTDADVDTVNNKFYATGWKHKTSVSPGTHQEVFRFTPGDPGNVATQFEQAHFRAIGPGRPMDRIGDYSPYTYVVKGWNLFGVGTWGEYINGPMMWWSGEVINIDQGNLYMVDMTHYTAIRYNVASDTFYVSYLGSEAMDQLSPAKLEVLPDLGLMVYQVNGGVRTCPLANGEIVTTSWLPGPNADTASIKAFDVEDSGMNGDWHYNFTVDKIKGKVVLWQDRTFTSWSFKFES